MKALVTGGGGFVMANFLRHWLESDPDNRAVSVDAVPLDAAAEKYFAPVAGRIEFVEGNVAAPALWRTLPADIDVVVHGAAVTPHDFVDEAGVNRRPEHENPERIIETNILGTSRALAFARGLERLRRFIYVSTGSVYVEKLEGGLDFALPEDGYIGPRGLYDITKYSSELITKRYGELFGLSAVSVRLSNVFGPLDRQTPFRHVRNPANIVATAAAGETSFTVRDLNVPGDYVYAPDVARALAALARAPREELAHDVYNLAYGATVTIGDLVRLAQELAPRLEYTLAPNGAADIALDKEKSTGRWGAYDISRAARDFGWRPRPLAEAMREYVAWLREDGRLRPHAE